MNRFSWFNSVLKAYCRAFLGCPVVRTLLSPVGHVRSLVGELRSASCMAWPKSILQFLPNISIWKYRVFQIKMKIKEHLMVGTRSVVSLNFSKSAINFSQMNKKVVA